MRRYRRAMNGTLRPPLFGRLSVRHWATVDVLVACLLLVAAVHAAPRVEPQGLPIEFGYLLLPLWAAPVAGRRPRVS